MTRPAAGLATLAALAALALSALTAAAQANPAPRASLPNIERQVMCAVCGVPLNISQSPQADRERAFIQMLINRGEDTGQIKAALVAQYGPAVIATPSSHGFGLVAYLVPLALVAIAVLALMAMLPRWRRRARRSGGGDAVAVSALSTADQARLDTELARFDG